MKTEEIKSIIHQWQKSIDNKPYAPLIPYPYCCECFERLTEHNVVVDTETIGQAVLTDQCKTCLAIEQKKASPIMHENCHCHHCGPPAPDCDCEACDITAVYG